MHQYLTDRGIKGFAESRGVEIGSLIFALGALVYPKHMLKACDPNYSEKNALILRKEIKNFWTVEARKVIKIYHYMYRFSVDRLHKFKKDPALVCLLEYYAMNNLIDRMNENNTMMRHREAYFEAIEKMLEKQVKIDPKVNNKIILLKTEDPNIIIKEIEGNE